MSGLRSGIASVLALGAALPALASDGPAATALEPYQIVRSLELVQDRLAGGDHASQPMQRKLLEMIDARFATKEGSRFENELNRRALLIYAMSGGNPATVEAAIARLGKDDPSRKLGESILFYINGEPKKAIDAFTSIDPTAHGPDISMYLALVKGSVLAEAKPKDALALLDRARLLGPGTLVEEAALRRSIAVAVALGDANRFVRLSEQYVRAYLRSPYASQFADAFVAGIVALHATVDRQAAADIAALMDPEQEKVIYLRVARRAAIDGLSELAAFAASHAEEVGEDPRAALYSGLSSVTSGKVEDVIDSLSKIDRDSLSESDRQLLDAASAIAAGLKVVPAGTKHAQANVEPADMRIVGPQPVVSATPAAQSPAQSRNRGPSRSVDASVEQAAATVASTRAKLVDIDRLIGDMPE